ncbi:MAG: hypothetical protein R6U39_01160 [Candidatus Aegiribacteria sp.]
MALCLALMVAVFAAGCHQVTEFGSVYSSSITFIRTSDLQVERTMGGFELGRLLAGGGPGKLVLVASDGVLYRIDSSQMAVDTSYSIGGSSGTGYSDAARAGNGSLYVLGPGSQVLEVDLDADEVVDGFTPGADPVAISASTSRPRLYFADGAGSYIGEIWTGDNHTGFNAGLQAAPADIMVEPAGGKHVVVVCSDQQGSIYDLWLDYSEEYPRKLIIEAGSPCSRVQPFGIDSSFAIACPQWSGNNGYICLARGYVDPETVELTTEEVQGHPVDLCFNPSIGYAGMLSALSRTDSGNTVVTVFSFIQSYLDPELEAVIELDGFPRDIISPGNGEYIIVLTSD